MEFNSSCITLSSVSFSLVPRKYGTALSAASSTVAHGVVMVRQATFTSPNCGEKTCARGAGGHFHCRRARKIGFSHLVGEKCTSVLFGCRIVLHNILSGFPAFVQLGGAARTHSA